jgi:hypothetical protein
VKRRVNAKYKCLKCGLEYESDPGPTQCPSCGHLYIDWLNYEYFEKLTNIQLDEIQKKKKEKENERRKEQKNKDH